MDLVPHRQPLIIDRAESCISVLLAAPRDSMGSSSSVSEQSEDESTRSDCDKADKKETHPITLGLTIRRTRLIAFTVAMVAVIVGLTLFFRHGVALMYFDSHTLDPTEQTDLLDDYNSYSGNVASMFAKPIELFVTVAVQLIVLRFMADTFTRPDMSWKTSAVTLLLGAVTGFLIGNGFNALNIQLRPQAIEPIISPQDLELHTNFTDDNRSTSYSNSVEEMQPRNVVANTVLRSAIKPKHFRGDTNCPWDETTKSAGGASEVKEAYVNLGFMQRDWQGRILQEAPSSTTLRVVVNPTNKSINDQVGTANNLPMNVSLAADLFYHAITIGTAFFPWGERHAFVNRSDIAVRYPVNDTEPHKMQANTTTLYGLLPQDASADETAQHVWFLRESVAAMSRQFSFSQRTKRSDLVMAFTHTQLTPTIAFDAVTFEVEIDPMLIATVATAKNATRYTVLDSRLQCPESERCMLPKASYTRNEIEYDPPAQVFALDMCRGPSDNEVLRTNFTRQNTTTLGDVLACAPDGSRFVSMLTVSVAKRLVADALTQNMSASSNGTRPDPARVTVTNLRKIYSFTVGRLSWAFTDLARTFNARCGSDKEGACDGLEIALSAPLDATVQIPVEQRLIVGRESLPDTLLASVADPLALARTNLVVLDEPPRSPTASDLYEVLAGDLLLLHNIGNLTWNPNPPADAINCSADVEDRIVQTLDNHMYMEHGLQTSYTSAMYFLFMYGSVKDAITVNATLTSLTFDGNKQAIAVWASTPAQNMWLTLAGCFILAGGLLAALAKATWFTQKDDDVLANITQPQAIARVMVDKRKYPPMFLQRRVVEKEGATAVDDYAMDALSSLQ